MDVKLLEYMIAIADCGNITKAAESLFITQSGLNQQLIRLENELNTQLFYRTKRHLHLTQAGKIYIDNAREILKIKKNTYTTIQDQMCIRDRNRANVRRGITVRRSRTHI